MPKQLETRKVSISKWYKPWSWGKFIEKKTFYFTFDTLEEMDKFLSGEFNEYILRDRMDIKETDVCQ